jgi:glyoxylase-like metal-dependent hydrolase (beta-lactamase superfamily II)
MDEGAYEVIPGIHRIPLPLPTDALKAVNVYAIAVGERLTLVDGGWALAESRAQLERSLKRIGASVGDIDRFLVTHMHRDHYTQAIAIRRLHGSTVSLGEHERPNVEAMLAARAHGCYSGYSGEKALLRAGATDLAARMSSTIRRSPVEFFELPDFWLTH